MAFYICPNCKDRSIDDDGRQGLTHQPVACERCGFGFLFQLLDDYYPSPLTGLVTCDKSGRILASGRGVFELTGYAEGELMGRGVVECGSLVSTVATHLESWREQPGRVAGSVAGMLEEEVHAAGARSHHGYLRKRAMPTHERVEASPVAADT